MGEALIGARVVLVRAVGALVPVGSVGWVRDWDFEAWRVVFDVGHSRWLRRCDFAVLAGPPP